MSNRILMSLIMGPIGPEQLELFALEFGKTAAFDFVYSLASTNINQSAPNLVTMYMTGCPASLKFLKNPNFF